MLNRAIALIAALAMPCAALAWQEPARGSELRADLLDSIRPLLEWQLGAPVEIVVNTLRVDGDRAFVSAQAQRPGGMAIDLAATPMARRGEYYPEISDGTTIQALIQRSGRMWVPVHHAVGATDVWFIDPEFCAAWRPVLNDYCN
jgi:hypothetical protein